MDFSSFDDSDQFEDDTSWVSGDSDQGLNWSGWKRTSPVLREIESVHNDEHQVTSLIELCARRVAQIHPFEVIELHDPPIPDALQLRIAYYSFPEDEEDIRLYSCLASGSNDKFKHGEVLVKSSNVQDVVQIGFHLSGVVTQPGLHTPAKQLFNVSITFDRGHITSCQCSCQSTATWCEHANALCLYRIHNKKGVALRAPVAESLARLERDQLQKFVQYLISELPQQILPTAQRLLDDLLSSKTSAINVIHGAPDPTGGASITEEAKWILEETSLQENIKKILSRFCGTLPFVIMDNNSNFLTSVPPVSLEWSNLLRSFQGHEPEALWNLLSIVRHLFARGDKNAAHLLHIITEECLLSFQMMFYWVLSYDNTSGNSSSLNDASHFNMPFNELSRHASAHFMEEVVRLWEVTIMTPFLHRDTKLQMKLKFDFWNQQVIEAARKGQGHGIAFSSRTIRDFMAFKTPLVAFDVEWDRFYEVLGISPRCQPSNSRIGAVTLCSSQSVDAQQLDMNEIYPRLVSLKPVSLEEFTLINKLTQSLHCHGYTTHASKLACFLGHRIVTTYPERVTAGELNFTEITEKAKELCEMLMGNCTKNERITFELAILGLTVPRLPAATNLEEMKLIYLETELYKRLKGMPITEERLTFIRYQARKLLSKPMLRGDIVLPYIIAMFIFEVLCEENVTQCCYSGQNIVYAETFQKCDADKQLGYECALVTLGLYSNVVDLKQPMLCESIRQHRRDLSLALLLHCRLNHEKIEQILSVLLDRERYSSFMTSQQQQPSAYKAMIKPEKRGSKSHRNETPSQQSNPKYGFTYADANSVIAQHPQQQQQQSQQQQQQQPQQQPQQHHQQQQQSNQQTSDSDSGNGDTKPNKSYRGPTIPSTSTKKIPKQQRRHTRQNNCRHRNDKSNRGGSVNRGGWNKKENKGNRGKKLNVTSTSKLTDTDSGQEMNSPYEGDFGWPGQEEDWDAEMQSTSVTMAAPDLSSNQNHTNTNTELMMDLQSRSLSDPATSHDLVNPATYLGLANPTKSHVRTDPITVDKVLTGTDDFLEEGVVTDIQTTSQGQCSQPQVIKKSWSKNKELSDSTSGGGSLSSSSDSNKFQDIQRSMVTSESKYLSNENTGHINSTIREPDTRLPLILPELTVNYSSPDAAQSNVQQDDDDDDFNIAADMFRDLNVDDDSRITSSSKDDEREEEISDPLISSSSNDSLNVGDFSPDVALVANQVIVNGNEENEHSEDCDDHNDTDVNRHHDNSPSAASVVLPSRLSDDVNIISDEEKNNDALRRQIDVQNETSASASPVFVVADEQPPITPRSNEEPVNTLSGSSSVDSVMNDCGESESLSNNELKANGSDQKAKQNSIEINDLRVALSMVQQDGGLVETSSQALATNSLAMSDGEAERDSQFRDSQLRAQQKVDVESSTKSKRNNKKKPNKSKSKNNKSNKSKSKITMNMQSVEAEAFSLFELAKSLLTQSRNNNPGMFSADMDEVSTTNNMNRRLQLAAFEIGVFALNMHNYSSPNWFSRTYSTYVSWIDNHAVEIGTPALRLLNEKWEGVLTPSESITIASRASRVGDHLLKRTSAELALSCLPYSQSLNSNEINQTITLCREQDNDMLERACSAVENASRHGGIQPRLLFSIAREWHYLYENKSAATKTKEERTRPQMWNANPAPNSQSFVPMYMTAEQYVQERMHQQAQEILGRQFPRSSSEQHMWVYPANINNLHHVPLPQQAMHSRRIQNIDSFALPVNNYPDEMNFSEIPRHLENAYRVGMRALRALANCLPDDSAEVRFNPTPACSDDIRWMLMLAASLGPSYLKNFCKVVYKAVNSPYLLHDLALEAARHFALFNPAHLASYLKSPSLIPIVQKSLAAYEDMVHHKLVLLQTKGYSEFVELLRRARSAFCMAPGGMARFNEILDFVRKTYPKKCELWQRIMNGLSTA